MGLVISTSDYGAPIWFNSCHTQKVDVQIKNTLRTITGTVRATPVPWLYVLSNIAPPELRRKAAVKSLIHTCMTNKNSLLYEVLQDRVFQRLNSRQTISNTIENLKDFDLKIEWRVAWEAEQVINHELIDDPTKKVPGFELDRRAWVTVNRIRTNQGRCNYCLFKWGVINSPMCDCGPVDQTITHIIGFCQTRRFSGNLNELHQLETDRSIQYVNNLDVNL